MNTHEIKKNAFEIFKAMIQNMSDDEKPSVVKEDERQQLLAHHALRLAVNFDLIATDFENQILSKKFDENGAEKEPVGTLQESST